MGQPQQFEERPSRDRHRALKIIVVASLIFDVILAFAVVNIYYEAANMNSQLNLVVTQNENLTTQLNSVQQKNELLKNQIDFYRNQTEYYQRQLERETAPLGVDGKSTVDVVAVREIAVGTFMTSYEGVAMKLDVELQTGEGMILIDTEPRIGIDLQTSARTAAIVAENYTGIPLEKTDIIIMVRATEAASIVDGPSAGAAITAAIIAAISNQTLAQQVYITGTINPDGTVGRVGGVLYKAMTAAESGATKFLVPPSQSIVDIYIQEEREIVPGFILIVTKQETVDLQSYLQQHGYDIKVVEAGTIGGAYPILRSG